MTTELLLRLRDLILQKGNLCSFYGNTEAEVLIGQTVIAAAGRADDGGEPFSFLGDNALRGLQRCGTDNAAAYARLLADEMFQQETRPASALATIPDGVTIDGDGRVPVVFPTDALLEKLAVYFEEGPRTETPNP